MRKLLAVAVLLSLSLFALALPTHAGDNVPILSMERVSLGAAADYCGFQKSGDQPLPAYSKSWELGLIGSYTLVAPKPGEKGPILSLAAASSYDVDNKWFRHRLGLRLVVFRGGKD